VLLPGYVENKALFFAALDLFLMPSRSEGWGLAALEAMAHGVPVIASRTGGLMEIIDDGENGCLVEPGDAGALAEAIAGAARDRKQLAEMGRQGRERARDFSLEETAARTDAFYLRLRGRGRGPGQSPAAA
jgi:glycosyltransferase involved in cell wall biosynthesis